VEVPVQQSTAKGIFMALDNNDTKEASFSILKVTKESLPFMQELMSNKRNRVLSNLTK
jgi:hypothetical protein